jgi:hypothetical protein
MATKISDQELSDLAALLAAGYEVKLAPWPDDMGGGCRADVTGAGTSSHGYGATPAEALRAVPVWPLADEGRGDELEELEELGPEPYCTSCGASAGIFIAHGDAWLHYTGQGTVASPVELLDADHEPVIGWRPAA